MEASLFKVYSMGESVVLAACSHQTSSSIVAAVVAIFSSN